MSLWQLATLCGFGSLTVISVVYLIIRFREQSHSQTSGTPNAMAPRAARYLPGGAREVTRILREASTTLRKSGTFKGRTLKSMPVYLVIGDQASGKTSLVLNSGLQVNLLAGQDKQGMPIGRSASLNVWLIGDVLVIDVPAQVWGDAAATLALTRALRPSWWSILVRRRMVSREVVTCLPAGLLREELRVERLRTVEAMNGFLLQAAAQLRASLPVFAVFTKTDSGLFGFSGLFANLNNDEYNEVLGAALNSDQLADPALYDNVVVEAIDSALSRLVEFQQTKRTLLLSRELEPANAWQAFEFPGQLEAARDALASSLQALGRPSLLDTSPILRGFYFTGTRQVGKRQEWIFSHRLLWDGIFKDEAAQRLSGQNRLRVRFGTALSWAATAVFLTFAAGFVTSYIYNGSLEKDLLTTGTRTRAAMSASSPPPVIDALSRMRVPVERLIDYRQTRPWRLGWGLYAGRQLFPPAKSQFCAAVKYTLLDSVSHSMAVQLASAASGTTYDTLYRTLKAYLMMSSYPQNADADFLSTELAHQSAQSSLNGRNQDFQAIVRAWARLLNTPEDREACLIPVNLAAVRNAQDVLRKASADDQLYTDLKNRAAQKAGKIDYNALHPNDAVRNDYIVPGEFTAGAWTTMQGLLKQPDNIKGSEPWVLGGDAKKIENENLDALATRLSARYSADYRNAWRQYLNGAKITPFANLKDASSKLETLSSGRALAWLLSIAKDNTAVDKAASDAFQPVHQVIAKATDFSPDLHYAEKLVAIRTNLERGFQQSGPARDASFSQAGNEAANARTAVATSALTFQGDMANRVKVLLLEPLNHIDSLVQMQGATDLSGAAASLCGPYAALYSKFPFQRNAKTSATREEVLNLLRPADNPLMSLYNSTLTESMSLQPTGFAIRQNPKNNIRPEFLQFANRVWLHSHLLYGAPEDPKLALTFRLVPGGQVQSIDIVADEQHYVLTPGSTAQVSWSLTRSSNLSIEAHFPGLQVPPQQAQNDSWGIFRWLYGAVNPSTQPLQWLLRWGSLDPSDNSGPSYQMDVRFADGSPFDARRLSGVPCVLPVAK